MPPLLQRLCRVSLTAGLIVWSAGTALSCLSVRAEAGPVGVELECRLKDGPWQKCRMEVQQVGIRWILVVGDQRIEFRHDQRGSVTMLRPPGGWQPVNSRWEADTSLCWDGVCARGDIPLD